MTKDPHTFSASRQAAISPADAGTYNHPTTMEMLLLISTLIESRTWLSPREVALLCQMQRREREERFANMECQCGAICQEGDGHIPLEDEHICKECR
jgi:hypothetical protein